jgi:hypothetical protein
MSDELNLPAALRTGFLWVTMSALGGGIGFTMGHKMSSMLPDSIGRTGSDTVLFAVFGSLIGIAQWLILRTRIAKAGWWVLVSFLVWVVTGASAYPLEQVISLALCPVVAGVVLGIFQSLVLRRHVRWSGLWIVASGLGWGLSWPAAGGLDWVVASVVVDEIVGFAVLYAIIAAISGVFTGPALVLLMRRSQLNVGNTSPH